MSADGISPIEPAFTPADFASLRLIIPFASGQEAIAAIQREGRAPDMPPFIQTKLRVPPAS
jgi:hypothetical protein